MILCAAGGHSNIPSAPDAALTAEAPSRDVIATRTFTALELSAHAPDKTPDDERREGRRHTKRL